MDRYGKWEVIRPLGSGGQSNVYLAKNTDKTGDTTSKVVQIRKSVVGLSAIGQSNETQLQLAGLLVEAVSHLIPNTIDPSTLGALKVLHKPRDTQGYAKAKERMKREVETLSNIHHPNILRILDDNLDEGWFVGEYHSRGPLSGHQSLFKGDMLRAIEAFQPLVEGVCEMHKAGIVHRDIKPQNVFLSDDNHLVLGDLGIVFFSDQAHTRITDSYENVGSRDWMPGWAMSMRIEDVSLSFDVFSLGKVFWAMLSGRTLFPLWYHHKAEHELERMFPRDESIRWARNVLDTCVVENEEDCLPDAERLLAVVDEMRNAVKRHAQVVTEGVLRRCEVCGVGEYSCVIDENHAEDKFGLRWTPTANFKIFTCSHCGHVQMFHIPDPKSKPKAWTVKS